MTEQQPKSKAKKSTPWKAIIWNTVLLGTCGYAVDGCVGRTDRKAAEDLLTNEQYKIVNYEGKAGVFERDRAYYSDKFNVVSPNGNEKTVVVTRQMFSDVQAIRYLKPQ